MSKTTMRNAEGLMKRILITGGCGFIGTSLIKDILAENSEGLQIRILDSLLTGTLEDLSEVCAFKNITSCTNLTNTGVYFIHGDIRDANLLIDSAENVDCIVHLAANTGVGPSVENPRLDMESNVCGIFNALEAARIQKVKKFVFASSGAPAGEVIPPIHEEMPAHPVSPYGASKLAGEGYCSAYFRTFGVETVCLRFGNVYGPRSKHKASVVAKFIKQALANEECIIYGDGTQTRDFIYITDLIKAIRLSMNSSVGGEIFQIASGKEHTVDEVAHMIANELKKYDVHMKIIYSEPRLGDVKRNYSDTSKASSILGWKSETELQEGISKTVSYFRG